MSWKIFEFTRFQLAKNKAYLTPLLCLQPSHPKDIIPRRGLIAGAKVQLFCEICKRDWWLRQFFCYEMGYLHRKWYIAGNWWQFRVMQCIYLVMNALKAELCFTETPLLPAWQLNSKKRTRVYVYFYKQLASRQGGNKILGEYAEDRTDFGRRLTSWLKTQWWSHGGWCMVWDRLLDSGRLSCDSRRNSLPIRLEVLGLAI